MEITKILRKTQLDTKTKFVLGGVLFRLMRLIGPIITNKHQYIQLK
jgi:hypothetical protein